MKIAFISYASKDSDLARSIKNMLEERSISCWMAPDDITPGKDYAEEIIRGIESTQATILLLSEHANASQFVKREIERAVSKSKPVFPVRLSNVQPLAALELFISSAHWIDVCQGPLAPKMDLLAGSIQRLNGDVVSTPKPVPHLAIPEPTPKPNKWKAILIGSVLGALGIAGGYAYMAAQPLTPVTATTKSSPLGGNKISPDPTPPSVAPPIAPSPKAPLPATQPVQEALPPRVDSRTTPIHKPTPAVATKPSPPAKTQGTGGHSNQCSNILLKASLGESLSPDEQSTLKTRCQ